MIIILFITFIYIIKEVLGLQGPCGGPITNMQILCQSNGAINTIYCTYDDGETKYKISTTHQTNGKFCTNDGNVCCNVDNCNPINGDYSFQIQACNRWTYIKSGKGKVSEINQCNPRTHVCVWNYSALSPWVDAAVS
jgi:hypothetical protein